MRRRKAAFSMPELLVVIGIIALLVSILAPVLSRVREQARCAQCLGNLRQLGMAFQMYLSANEQYYPRPASNGLAEDWIYWEDTPATPNASRQLGKSAIARYLGQPSSPDVFRCPSDDVDIRRSGTNYRYSYSANYLILRLDSAYGNVYGDATGNNTLRATRIVNPSDKLVLIDESQDTADDGCWAWMSTFGSGENVMSARHMRRAEQIALLNVPSAGWGNALFADGHAAYIERKASFDPKNFDPLLRN